MRVVGFDRMMQMIEEKTQLDRTDIRLLSQPWMYGILFVLTLLLLWVDGLDDRHSTNHDALRDARSTILLDIDLDNQDFLNRRIDRLPFRFHLKANR